MIQSCEKHLDSRRLAELLRVPLDTLKTLRHQKALMPCCFINNNRLHYDEESVNSFLATRKQNLRKPLTLQDLLSSNVGLLTLTEALDYSGFSKNYILNKRSVQRIEVATHQTRFVQSSLPKKSTAEVGLDLASHITGQSPGSLRQLITDGVLQNDSQGEHRIAFHRDQMLRFLRGRLPVWLSPEEWFEERRHSPLPLLRFGEAIRQLGTKTHLLEAMDSCMARYVYFNHSQSYSPESIAAFVAQEEIVRPKTLATLVGVHYHTVTKGWGAKGYRICPIHDHKPGEWDYKKTCILAFLSSALPPNASRMSPDRWFVQQTTHPQELIAQADVASYLSVSHATVMQFITADILRGLRLPDGSQMFTPRQLLNRKTQLRNADAKR